MLIARFVWNWWCSLSCHFCIEGKVCICPLVWLMLYLLNLTENWHQAQLAWVSEWLKISFVSHVWHCPVFRWLVLTLESVWWWQIPSSVKFIVILNGFSCCFGTGARATSRAWVLFISSWPCDLSWSDEVVCIIILRLFRFFGTWPIKRASPTTCMW